MLKIVSGAVFGALLTLFCVAEIVYQREPPITDTDVEAIWHDGYETGRDAKVEDCKAEVI